MSKNLLKSIHLKFGKKKITKKKCSISQVDPRCQLSFIFFQTSNSTIFSIFHTVQQKMVSGVLPVSSDYHSLWKSKVLFTLWHMLQKTKAFVPFYPIIHSLQTLFFKYFFKSSYNLNVAKPTNIIFRYENMKFLLIFSLTILAELVTENISNNFIFSYRKMIFVCL